MPTALDPLAELIALQEAHLAVLVKERLAAGEIVKLPPPMPLAAFVIQAWDKVDPEPYVHGRHIEAICEHLEAVAQGQIRQLLINIPPRYSKSLISAVMFPAWVWTWWPSAKFIYVSYSSALSLRDALKARDLMQSAWYQRLFAPAWTLKADQNAKGRYENTARGFRVSTSVGAMATGEGGDFVCLPGSERVLTSAGWVPIGQIVEERLPVEIAAFDQRRDGLVWRPLTAYQTRTIRDAAPEVPSTWLYALQTVAGCALTLTGNHPVYVRERGYVPAHTLQPGEQLVRSPFHTDQAVATSALPAPLARAEDDAVVTCVPVGHAEVVYNLSVAGENNYFAEGILVHNCGDDLHAVDEDYSSTRAELLAAVDFWRTTMPSRVTNWKTTARIVVGQRIAEDDVSGAILANDDYDYLVLPQRYAPPSVHAQVPVSHTALGFVDWRTEPGELLCPARMGETEDAALTLSPSARAAQFQQQPTDDTTSLFKSEDWRFYLAMPPLESFDFAVQTWDFATKRTETSSHVAGHVWGFKACQIEGIGPGYAPWLLDRVYARMDFPESVHAVEDLTAKWPTVTRKLIEDKANGTPVYAVLRGVVPGLVPIDPGKFGGKKQRAEAVAWLQRRRLAWLPSPTIAPWVNEYIALMQRFAGDPRDEADDVDATSQAWRLALPAPKDDVEARRKREAEALRQKIFQAAQRERVGMSKSRI